MDFDEWMDGIEANDYDDIICAVGDAFKAGQQSKQAEIDKIKELLRQWDNWISVSANHNCIDIVKECADELREFLK